MSPHPYTTHIAHGYTHPNKVQAHAGIQYAHTRTHTHIHTVSLSLCDSTITDESLLMISKVCCRCNCWLLCCCGGGVFVVAVVVVVVGLLLWSLGMMYAHSHMHEPHLIHTYMYTHKRTHTHTHTTELTCPSHTYRDCCRWRNLGCVTQR